MKLEQNVTALLQQSGCWGEPTIKPLFGGKNNRVFRVESNGKSFLLKSYFWHPADKRERLKAEFQFSTFLWERGIRNIPQPFAQDPIHQLGLYEFVVGKKITEVEITRTSVQQALDFFRNINRYRKEEAAANLPAASEVCFKLEEHLCLIEQRLKRLMEIRQENTIDAQARDFVLSHLCPSWNQTKETILKSFQRPTSEEKCLSPSDFGFHNALLTPQGTFTFHDFEYAGWDDPARMVSDFFCQPELPVPLSFFEDFAQDVFTFLGNREEVNKARLLLPAYRIKWCCILLNEFLTDGSHRRRFAQIEDDIHRNKAEQLEKSKAYFKKYL